MEGPAHVKLPCYRISSKASSATTGGIFVCACLHLVAPLNMRAYSRKPGEFLRSQANTSFFQCRGAYMANGVRLLKRRKPARRERDLGNERRKLSGFPAHIYLAWRSS